MFHVNKFFSITYIYYIILMESSEQGIIIPTFNLNYSLTGIHKKYLII